MLLALVAESRGGELSNRPLGPAEHGPEPDLPVQRRRNRPIPAALATTLLAALTPLFPGSDAAAGAAASPPMEELTVTSTRTPRRAMRKGNRVAPAAASAVATAP